MFVFAIIVSASHDVGLIVLSDRLKLARPEAIAIYPIYIKHNSLNLNSMSRSELIKLRIREFAAKEGWTLKELSERSGVSYSTIKTYAVSEGMVMADLAALRKLAQTFDVLIEDLLEVVQE